MMRRKLYFPPQGLVFAAAIAFLPTAQLGRAQSQPAKAPVAGPVQVTPAQATAPAKDVDAAAPDRTLAYYHLGLASNYEEQAIAEGRAELVTRAIEEYKLALNADPDSPELNLDLADLYFRTGRAHEAESEARELLKSAPDNIEAHKLLGRIYLRQLGEGQSAQNASGNVLELAITEFEKIISLQPTSAEDHMVLGQLYTVKHQVPKAEAEFKTAETLEPDSEDAVLNLARLYAESGDLEHAVKVIEAIPADDRSPKMEVTLGATYDQLKRSKDAIDAYRRAAALEPGDVRILGALGQALLADNQLDEALKQFKTISEADPEDVEALVRIAEIERRQGKYAEALTTIRKARKKQPESLEAGYNEGLLLDVLGRYDDAAQVLEKMVDLTSHANGAYKEDEKNNRAIFLERLGTVYHEQNKTAESIAAYQKMIDMGGATAVRGYQFQVDTWRDEKNYNKAVEVARKAVAANPKDRDLTLMLASELDDVGKTDEGLTLAKSLLANTAEDRIVWLELGQMYLRARRWKEAEEALNKADGLTTKKEDRTYLLFIRGGLAERQKHYEPAEQFFRQALELDPDNAMTLNYMGYMLADKGNRLPEALKMVRKAVDLEPMNGAFLDSLGWVYFKMGDYELAEENLRHAVERDSTDPTVHDHLGDLYEKTGRIRLAAAQWEISLAQFAKSAPADVEPGEVGKVQKKLESARVKLAKQENAVGAPKPE
jgi:tetratricopeptide (TPR) repeat protein